MKSTAKIIDGKIFTECNNLHQPLLFELHHNAEFRCYATIVQTDPGIFRIIAIQNTMLNRISTVPFASVKELLNILDKVGYTILEINTYSTMIELFEEVVKIGGGEIE